MIKVIGKFDKCNEPYINTTSHSVTWSKGLSPFFVGPVKLYNGLYSVNMENAWQYCKVYSEFADESGEPTQKYADWAMKGWKNPHAVRYPMGKNISPLYSYWNGEKLGIIQARKKIYIPLYSEAVAKTDAFKKLKEMYEQNNDIILWDFDGYDYLNLGMSLKDVVNNKKTLGHAFVLAGLLTDKIDEMIS